ncbi:hypothetical protein M231_03731 [Tremella mesenterica]|uniref:SMP domain-containing protein n=1 Tax=Tremella mesenterica TaxID=5217 RepID=A0A4Q1BMD8_TREME|nr:hypothetical protein M231_03731 [Tremella mesenterica]
MAPMNKSDSSRIQSTQATGGKDMSSGGFAARAQSAGDRFAYASTSGHGGNWGSNYGGGKTSGGGGGNVGSKAGGGGGGSQGGNGGKK